MTAAKFEELKEYIESCKQKKGAIFNQITQTKSKIFHEENKLEKAEKDLVEAFIKEKEQLVRKISDLDAIIVNLNTQLHHKQTNIFSKLFGKQQSIDSLVTEINEKETEIAQLRTSEAENARFDKILPVSKSEFEANLFLKQFLHKKEELDTIKSLLDQYKEELRELLDQHAHARAKIDGYNDPQSLQQYKAVANAFGRLLTSNKIWGIRSETNNTDIKASARSLVARKEVTLNLKDIDFIESTEPGLYFESISGNHFYIYSSFIVLNNQYGSFNFFNLSDLKFSFRQQRFIEEKDTVPSDSKIVDHLWQKVNKDGTPDLRFKGNSQSPVVHYGVMNFSMDQFLNETFYVSHFEFAQSFGGELMSYLALIRPEDRETAQDSITKEYFDIVKEFGDQFVAFGNKLQNDKAFLQLITGSSFFKSQSFETAQDLVKFYLAKDLLSCFNLMGDLSKLKSKESFALLYILSKRNNLEVINTYTNIPLLYGEGMLSAYQNMFETFKPNLATLNDANIDFLISVLLSVYDPDLQKEYLSNLYRFASIVVKADGKITQDEEAALKRVLSLSEQHKTITVEPTDGKTGDSESQNVKVYAAPPEETVSQSISELSSLIGLHAVKQEINTLVNFIKIQKAREASGLKSSSLSYHIVFTGNPGTGKTTVARLVAEIYKSLGVLKKGHLVETDRSGLIAEYLGQTAVKVNRTVDSALNGILFIDEAYSLVGENRDDFGKEAVATLIKRMEDNRSNLIVILAGYSNEMKSFIDTNPGLKSRFNRYIQFADYIPDELMDIYKLSCSRLDYSLSDNAEQKLESLFRHSFESRDKSFGNGRFVRNIFEKTLEKQANRIASVATLSREILTTIEVNDVPDGTYI